MLSSWVLSALVACALIHVTFATTCTTATMETCEATSFVTSTCSSGNCGCVSGYTAIVTGCAPTNEPALPTPTVTSVNGDGAAHSGQVLEGENIVLTCSRDYSGAVASYVWLSGGAAISGEVSETYTISSIAASINVQITCTYTVGSTTSSASASFNVVSFADGAAVPGQPVVTGLPSTLVNGMTYTLVCSNIPIVTGLVVTFAVDGTNIMPAATTYDLAVISSTATGTSITCTISLSSGTSTFASAASPAVTTTAVQSVAPLTAASAVVTPSMPLVGGYMIIRCPVAVTDLSTVTYSWTYNGMTIIGQRDHAIQINELVDATHGSGQNYVCTASSTAFYRFTGTIPVTVSAVAAAAIPTIGGTVAAYGLGSSYTLTCVTTSLTPGMTFSWMTGGNTVGTLQTLTITATSTSTSYTCATTFGGSTRTSAAEAVVGVNVRSATVSGPTAPVQSVSATYTCVTSRGASSGTVVYSWTLDGTAISGETSETYTIPSVAAANDGALRCIATVGTEVTTSAPVAVASIAEAALAVPTITVSPTDTNVGGTYVLSCVSPSAVPSATYTWRFTPTGGSVSTIGTQQTFTISSATTSNNGAYTCSITIGSTTMSAAAATTVTIGSAGLPCTTGTLSVCATDFSLYTGNCIIDRCECQSDATLGPQGCTNSATSVAGSLILILLTYIASRVSFAGI